MYSLTVVSLVVSLLANIAVASEPANDHPLLVVPAEGSAVHFQIERTARDKLSVFSRHEIGYFYVDAPDGRILRRVSTRHGAAPILDSRNLPQFVRPSDPEYAEFALRDGHAKTLFAGGIASEREVDDLTVALPGDRFIGFFLIEHQTLESWRYATAAEKPRVWFSFPSANPSALTAIQELRTSTHSGWNTYEWKLPESICFSYHILPLATDDAFTVFCSGSDFRGDPMPLEIDTPHDIKNRGMGLFYNDRAFDGCKLRVTHIRVENSLTDWIAVKKADGDLGRAVIEQPQVHGSLTVFENGGVQFLPNVADRYWHIESHQSEPLPVMIEYRISDGIDSVDCRFGIGHGHYHRGGEIDHQHEGSRLYFLAGGGRGVPFDEGRTQFFTLAGSDRDIVIIAQSLENKDFANRVFEYFAANRARSITCLSITSRSQADDPRLARVIDGADVLWFGGGSQSFFLESWKGTLVHRAIRNACAAGVSVGGTSAGSAILGAAAYADLPWDSVQSCFALRDPEHDRLRTISQGEDGFPFESLSSPLCDPLYGLIVETHFVDSNRMGRLAVFASRCRERPMSGLGLAACTAVLIKPVDDDWSWTVFGSGSVFVIDPGAAYCLDKGAGRKDYHCDRVHVVRMRSGEQLRLSEIRNAPPSYRAFIREGVVYTLDNAGRLY